MSEIHPYRDPATLVESFAGMIHTLEASAIEKNGRFTIALSGGSTPRALYQFLATSKLPFSWGKWHVCFGDERTVPPNHADSNYRMAKESLFEHVAIPENHIYRIHGELEPDQAAGHYETQLTKIFGDDDLPRFDLILLGMGDDGHTASLFPHTKALQETKKWVVANFVQKLDTWRITLTVPVINNAQTIAFIVTGENKAERLNEVINGDYQPDTLPSQLIQPTNGQLLWIVDEAAAKNL